MASYNLTVLIGNLTRDPEIKYAPSGTAICNCTIAVNRNWSGQDGEKKEETAFIDISIFGKTAESVAQYLKKGRSMLVEGYLKQDSWEDKESGQKRTKLKVVANRIQFLGDGKKPDEQDDGAEESSKSKSSTKQKKPAPKEESEEGSNDYADDVPF